MSSNSFYSNSMDIPHNVIHSIPPELWTIIFIQCLPNDPSPNDPPASNTLRDSRNAPVTLSSVCRSWRQVACTTPGLWASCWVSYLYPELNTLWLGCAKGRTLHLYGKHHIPRDIRYHEYDPTLFNWEPLFRSILPFQAQWQTVELELGDWGIMDLVPTFQTFELRTFRLLELDSNMPSWMAGMLPVSFNLRKLEVDSVELHTPSCIFGVQLPFLSELTINQGTLLEALLVLSEFPHLRHFSTMIFEEESPLMTLTDVTNKSLISLTLHGEFDASLLLDNLTLPSLEQFKMARYFEVESFVDFVNRSGCRIKELSIGDTWMWEEELTIRTLAESSTLHWVEELEVPGFRGPVTPDLKNLLQHSNFPRLRKLIINALNLRSMPKGTLAEIVISCCTPPICQCNRCSVRRYDSKIQLRQLEITRLGTTSHDLDIACLSPLPEDTKTAADSQNTMIIHLPIGRWTPESEYDLHDVKYFLKSCPYDCMENLSDGLQMVIT